MSLDARVARLFDDPEPTRFGSGWFSGTLSVFLGLLSLGAVACFYWPALLTSPDVRAVLPMPFVRTLLQIVIGVGFLLGFLSMLLRRRKVLGLTGVTLALLAGLAGGGDIPVESAVPKAPVYLGLDWFLLNLFLLALLFVPLERLWPKHAQSVFRSGWTTDTIYFFVSHLLVQVSTLLTLMPAQVFFDWAVHPGVQEFVRGLPVAVQFLACAVVADLTEYTVHRVFHTTRWLWPFHAVHHSSESMDWLAGSRLHVVDVVLTRGLTFVPLFVLGFDTGPLYAYLVFVSMHAVFIHANVSWEFPAWVERLIVTPRLHHLHHAIDREAWDRNFAVHFPWIDRLFGTYYGPVGVWPTGYGLTGESIPDSFTAQLTYPLRAPLSSLSDLSK
jgi:sterol desaturase/sphingolipid hydroxylase (fatty acid hydroxylase superfamily)